MRRRRLNPLSCCGGGCLGALLFFAILYSVIYSITGHYQPAIPSQKRPPAINGYDDFVMAARMAQTGGATNPVALTGAQPIPVLRQQLAIKSNALNILRAGLGKECLVTYVRAPGTQFPQLGGFRELARLLAAEELVKSADGDYAGAMQAGLDGLQFSQEIMRGGPLIHALVAGACQAIVERPMVDAVEHLDAADCDKFATRLTRLFERQPEESETLTEERAFSMTTLARISTMAAYGGQSGTPYEQTVGGMAWHFMRDRTIQELSDYFNKGIEQVRKPYSQRIRIPYPRGYYSSMFAFDFGSISNNFARSTIHTRLLLCALAIRSYRLKHGRLPSSLAAVGLPALATTDPCTSQPFKYHPKGSDYLLYSVGPDGKDDGGDPASEVGNPVLGDMGILSFRRQTGGKPDSQHRHIPHMKLPLAPKGKPPLN